MQVILLEKINHLGDLGDIVKVKDGYARNFLIPTKRAKRATEAAIAEFEARRAGEIINAFRAGQIQRDRDVFVLRFWYRDTVPQISASMGLSESLVKSLLSRMKKKLREELREEGIIV